MTGTENGPNGNGRSAEDVSADVYDFVTDFVEDREAGRVRSLSDYLARFPEAQEEVAAEYLRMTGHEMPRAETAATSTTGDEDDRVGRYRLVKQLGRGGQGEVWLADDESLGRRVALKLLTALFVSEERRARFRREAESIARLEHPGLANVLEADIDGPVPYIAMRYVPGVDLGASVDGARRWRTGDAARIEPLLPWIPSNRGELARVLRFFERCARALHAAHEAGVLHRDVKPGNIMVTPEGEPVLLDFGLARDEVGKDGEAALTREGDVFGTLAYMAPEQLRGARSEIDARADVWALGVTLFEALTGEAPFEGAGPGQLAIAIDSGRRRDLRALNPAVTTDARVVVETALERSRERRYPNALALAEDLRRIAEYEPIQARPAGPMLRLRRWVRREPAWAAALGVTLLALVTGLVASLVALSRISTNFNRAQARLFCGEVPAFQAQSPAGALALGLEAVEFEDTWATRSVLYPPLLDLTLAAQYEMPERPVRGAAFVGSEGLVAAAADGTVRLFDRANGAQVAEVDVGDDARSLAVGNGSVFVGTAAGRVVALDAADLRTLWSERVVAEMVHDLVVDERRGIVIALAGARTVVALDGASGTERSRHTAQEGSLGALRRAGESDRLVATGRAFHGLAATRGDSALLFSLPDLDVVARLECGAPTRDAAVSRGSGRVVVVDDSGAARLFRLDDGSPLPLEDGGPAAWSVGQTAFSVAIDAKGATIVVAAADEEERFVRAWHAHAGESVRVEPQWTVRVPERVVDLAVSPDDRTVAAACWDNRVHTLDLERGTTIAQHAERNRPLHVLWSPDGDGALVSFGIATTIEEWRTRPLVSAFRLDLRELDPPAPLVWGRFTSDGEKVVVIDDRGRACIHASPARSDPDGPEPGALLARVDPDRGAADAGARVVLAADAPVALWVAPDGRSRVFDVSTSAVRAEISLAAALGPSPLREEAVALAPDGTTAAIIDAAGEAWIWRPDAAPFRLVRSEVADETPRALRAVRFGVDGDVFVVDGLGRVFRAPARTAGDAVSFEPLPSTPGSAEGPVALAVAPGGRELAVVLEGDRLERWSLPSGQRLPPSSGRISRRWVRYIADGRVLTVARGAGAATVSDGSGIVAQSGPLRHDDEITSCAVGPRGEIFATGSLDGTVFIRDVATCAPTGRVAVHTGAVRWVDVCDGPAGVRVLSSGDDGAMVLPVDILGEAERRAPRGLFPYERRTLAALVGDR